MKIVGKMEVITTLVKSWNCRIDLLLLKPKSLASGHPLILGRPWLATTDAYIGCQSRNMVICNGKVMKKLVLYPPAEPGPSGKPSFKENLYQWKDHNLKMKKLDLPLPFGRPFNLK